MWKEATVGDKKIEFNANHDGTVLGRVFWYSVGGTEVPCDQLKEMFTALGIPDELFPNKVHPSDVFKRVCQMHHELRGKVNVDGEVVEFVDMVRINKGKRVLVRETKHERLQHVQMGEWTYDADKETMAAEAFDSPFRAEFDAITSTVMAEFEHFKTVYTDEHIRNLVRDVIHSTPYIKMRDSGGVYFIPESYAPLMDKFSALLRQVCKDFRKTDTETELIALPVVDSEPHRDMLVVKYESDAKGRIDSLLRNVTEILKVGAKVTPATYSNLIKEKDVLTKVKEQYENLLETQMETTNEELNILKEQLKKMIERDLVEQK